MADKADVVLIGVPKKLIVDALSGPFNLHVLPKGSEKAAKPRRSSPGPAPMSAPPPSPARRTSCVRT